MSVSDSTTTEEQAGEVIATVSSLEDTAEDAKTLEMNVVGTKSHSHAIVD